MKINMSVDETIICKTQNGMRILLRRRFGISSLRAIKTIFTTSGVGRRTGTSWGMVVWKEAQDGKRSEFKENQNPE
jgi:hypothetical protein